MSSPADYYKSLPPISKALGTACFATTVVCQLGLLGPAHIALFHELVLYRFELESGPFKGRTADFLFMMIFGALSQLVLSVIPFFWSPFLGVSLVFMLLYVWSREFPNANINIYGLVTLKAFYLPWAMLGLDVIFGSPIMPDLLGIITGHMYYFLTVLHPLATGKRLLNTPRWLNRQVARWRIGSPATNTASQPERPSGPSAFRGRSHRLSE